MARVLVVAGTASGVGKTTITLGLLEAFRRRGLGAQAFKVGPDFIDPGCRELASGRPSYSLDGWMCGRDHVRATVARHAADVDLVLVEGVMGCFDGADPTSDDGSTAQVAKWLHAPVVLVIDASAQARSSAAVVRGFESFDPDLGVAAIIANRLGGEAHARLIREAMRGSCRAELVGGIPRDPALELPERHLGLVTAIEGVLTGERRERLATTIERSVDLDRLLAIPSPLPSGGGHADLRRVRWPPVSGRRPGRRRRDASFYGRCAPGSRQHAFAAVDARFQRGALRGRHATRRSRQHGARPRVPLLDARRGLAAGEARLSRARPRPRRARRGLPHRPHTPQLRTSPLRFESGAGRQFRRGLRCRLRAHVLARAVLLASIIVVATAPSAWPFTVADMGGRALTLPAPPQRIISLVPSVTELIFALGGQERLVGVTDFCDWPADAKRKPSVGGMISPSLETNVTLRPDLVIATDSGNRQETVAQLDRLRIPVFMVPANRLAEMREVTARLGILTGRETSVAPLVDRFDARIRAVAAAVAAAPRPRVLYVLWPEPR